MKNTSSNSELSVANKCEMVILTSRWKVTRPIIHNLMLHDLDIFDHR